MRVGSIRMRLKVTFRVHATQTCVIRSATWINRSIIWFCMRGFSTLRSSSARRSDRVTYWLAACRRRFGVQNFDGRVLNIVAWQSATFRLE
eukprot:6186296-Pleurochrysis_carterae.AAC.6